MGRTFLRHNTWWIAYCINGKERRESSRSADLAAAEQLLEDRLRECDQSALSGKSTA